MLALPDVVRAEGREEAVAHGRLRKVVLVHKVHEVLRGIVLYPQVGPERAHEARRGVPGVGVRPALLGLAQVLVVGEQVRERGRHGGVQVRVGRDVQRWGLRNVDAHVLLAHAPRRGRDPVDDQPAVVVLGRVQLRGLGLAVAALALGGLEATGVLVLLIRPHLRVPAEGPGRKDLGDHVASRQTPRAPRHEPVRVDRPDSRLAELGVVLVQEALERHGDLLALDPAEDALREARRLDDLEALQDRRLRRHQLQQQVVRLLDVPQPAVLARAMHGLVHRVIVPVHAVSSRVSSSQALYSTGVCWSSRTRSAIPGRSGAG